MLSEFRAKKIAKLFWFWDADSNGYLEKNDFELIADELSEVRGWEKGTEEHNTLMNSLMQKWAEAEKFADTDMDNRISLKEWIDFCEAFLTNEEMYQITITNVAQSIFDACDVDENGILVDFEFQLLFRIYGKTNQHASIAYSRISNNGINPPDKARVLTLLNEFFFSEDEEDLGNYFFGDLD